MEYDIETKTKEKLELNKQLTEMEKMFEVLNEVKCELKNITTENATTKEFINNRELDLKEINEDNLNKLKENVADIEVYRKSVGSLKTIERKVDVWKTMRIELMRTIPIDYGTEEQAKKLNKQLIDVMSSEVLFCPDIKKKCSLFEERKNKDIEKLSDEINKCKQKEKEFNEQYEKYTKAEEELGPSPEVDMVELKRLEDTLQEKENLLEEVNKITLVVETKRAELNALINVAKETLKKGTINQDRLKSKVLKLNKQLEDYSSVSSKNVQLQSALEEIEAGMVEKAKFVEVSEENKRTFDKNMLRLKEIDKTVLAINDKIEKLKLVKEAFGQNGLRAIIIDYVIPKLEDRINNILSKLSDFRIRLETQRTSLTDDKKIEGLFINIFNERGEEFEFSSYSGGERLKIVVAISEALSEVQNINFRILDELFVGLDDESIEKFAEIMTTLQARLPQLICISHLKNIKDLFDEKVNVVKKNGTSEIK